MGERRVVVSGASIAGLSVAFWMRRLGWQVTVIERAPAFRDGGQNVDVRGVAREVLDRMGLFEAVRSQNTTETGTVFVDADGRVTAELPSDGPDGATAELEVLRGDLARTIHDHLPPGVDSVHGDTIETVTESAEGLRIVTSAGRQMHCDLLVVAEGVRSATRDRVFVSGEVSRTDLDVTMVFGTIPRTDNDDNQWGRGAPDGPHPDILTDIAAGRRRNLTADRPWADPVLEQLITAATRPEPHTRSYRG
ncbi:FAD-dependent monooxygenase [Streptomyces cyaneofuscatus]|uniref:FAD-dependent monooxygenase n=1 Tax=Streptomyces cyaneofuscatus TaxID=66883 RepID=UPI0036DB3C41